MSFVTSKFTVLIALLFCAQSQASWGLKGNYAYSVDSSGYNVTATLFIDGREVSVGFSMYDPSCHGYSIQLENVRDHLVNDRRLPFKAQCIGHEVRMFIPEYQSGHEFVIDQFKRVDEVVLIPHGSRNTFIFDTVNFEVVHSGLQSVAKLTRFTF